MIRKKKQSNKEDKRCDRITNRKKGRGGLMKLKTQADTVQEQKINVIS